METGLIFAVEARKLVASSTKKERETLRRVRRAEEISSIIRSSAKKGLREEIFFFDKEHTENDVKYIAEKFESMGFATRIDRRGKEDLYPFAVLIGWK